MRKIISKGRINTTYKVGEGMYFGTSMPYKIEQTEPLSIIDIYAELQIQRLD